MSLIYSIISTTPLINPSTSEYGRKCDKLVKTKRRFKIEKYTHHYGNCLRKIIYCDVKHVLNFLPSTQNLICGYFYDKTTTLLETELLTQSHIYYGDNELRRSSHAEYEKRAANEDHVKLTVNKIIARRISANTNLRYYKMPFDLSLIYGWLVFCLLTQLNIAQNTGRCYSFKSGTTITGSEYRRDYDIDQKTCSEVCKFDACCMAYEYQSEEETCTLKTRSINGTVITAPNTVFGLCLDYADAERDRLWDHVINGDTVASFPQVPKEKCPHLCRSVNQQSLPTVKKWRNTIKRIIDKRQRKIFRRSVDEKMKRNDVLQKTTPAIMYSWRIDNEREIDLSDGTCQCISVLRSIGVSFGSFSGFL